ncbi:hypothetical protein SDC9_196251 [bioreactor metagenome]|uniref:Uncharacterized protein n=1 Tax=bioreactor metagenome TaxID=1076179 RepID=A0A645IBX3_9ZZZZ
MAAIEKMGYTSAQILRLQTPDYAGRTGYPSFQLTNNNANIRRIKKRIEELEKIALSASQEIKKVFGEITYLEADNRVQLLFPDKPADAIRKILKDHSFRFSPSRNNAWVRHLNNAGRYAAERAIKKISEL